MFLVRKELALALARLEACRFVGLWALGFGPRDSLPAGPTAGCSPAARCVARPDGRRGERGGDVLI